MQPGQRGGILEGGWIRGSVTTGAAERKDEEALLWCANHDTVDACSVSGDRKCVWHASNSMCLPDGNDEPGKRWTKLSSKDVTKARSLLALWRIQRDQSIYLPIIDLLPEVESIFTKDGDDHPVMFRVVPKSDRHNWYIEYTIVPSELLMEKMEGSISARTAAKYLPEVMTSTCIVALFGEAAGISSTIASVTSNIKSTIDEWTGRIAGAIGATISAVKLIISSMVKLVSTLWNAVLSAAQATFDLIAKILQKILDAAKSAAKSIQRLVGL